MLFSVNGPPRTTGVHRKCETDHHHHQSNGSTWQKHVNSVTSWLHWHVYWEFSWFKETGCRSSSESKRKTVQEMYPCAFHTVNNICSKIFLFFSFSTKLHLCVIFANSFKKKIGSIVLAEWILIKELPEWSEERQILHTLLHLKLGVVFYLQLHYGSWFLQWKCTQFPVPGTSSCGRNVVIHTGAWTVQVSEGGIITQII